VLYGTNLPEALDKSSPQQVNDHHKSQKDDYQVQLRTSKLETMAKSLPHATSHQSYSEFFHNFHDRDEFAMDVAAMGGHGATRQNTHLGYNT
jgi:hypothetical protein